MLVPICLELNWSFTVWCLRKFVGCVEDGEKSEDVLQSRQELFVVIEQQQSSSSSLSSSAASAAAERSAGLSESAVNSPLPSLTAHGRRTSSRHECQCCGKRYRSARYLRAHQLSHGGLKPLLCDICGQGFYAAVNLKRHVLVRHRHATGSPALCHVCDRCGKAFVAGSRLRRHIAEMHDNASRQRHTCDVCGATFANAGNLQRHGQLHSASPRPHVCHVCRRCFTQRSSLQAHFRLHDVEARRRAMCVCTVCGKQLSKSTNLRKHLLLHAPRPPPAPS